MAKIRFVNGDEVELVGGDERRIRRAINRSTLPFRILPSGVAINFGLVQSIDFGAQLETEEKTAFDRPQGIQPVENAETQDEKKIPLGLLKALLDDSKLTQDQFATKIGYSAQSLRLALREGRMSKAFSDAVAREFLPKERWAEFGVKAKDEVAEVEA